MTTRLCARRITQMQYLLQKSSIYCNFLPQLLRTPSTRSSQVSYTASHAALGKRRSNEMTDPETPIEHDEAQARGGHLSQKSGTSTPHSARVEPDLGDRCLALLGFFHELLATEEAEERPF